ncbi:hypothetical protein ACMHYJ_06315 [Castellaniella hirudinis]|uniref:hypothetical protein n=1 Tax=Castellaniella hirudinis TaxID=1144617 RepID=UPI0039C0726C
MPSLHLACEFIIMPNPSQDEIESILAQQRAHTQRIQELCEVVRRIEADTAGIVDIFQSLNGAFKVLHCIGKLARPIGWIAAAVTAVVAAWASIKHGVIK